MADERNLSLSELSKLAEKNNSIDKELYARLKNIITDHANGERELKGDGLIIESRLAGWHAEPHRNQVVSIYLDAPRKIRLNRIDGRDETVEEFAKREKSEQKRYQQYYGIDVTDLSIYDLILDTSTVSVKGIVKRVQQNIVLQKA